MRAGEKGTYSTGDRVVTVEITGVELPSGLSESSTAEAIDSDTPLVIGIAGPGGAGKDATGKFIEELGFVHVSSSDLLRDEMRTSEVGMADRDRRGQNHFANMRRDEFGGHYSLRLRTRRH